MPTNETGYRTLDVVNTDPRVKTAFKDSDGIWIWLNPGWTADPLDAHDIVEDTAGAALRRYRGIVKCRCAACEAAS